MEPVEASQFGEDIALNPNFREQEEALLHALLQATDYGILLSGLDRQDIIANRRLGELFGVTPQNVVESSPEAVRALVRAHFQDPEAFDSLLQEIYADPLLRYQDEIELVGETPRILRRFTAPVHGSANSPVGRLWTFLDITETKRLQQEVQRQLEARTQDYWVTSEVLRVMNGLCRCATSEHDLETLLRQILLLLETVWNDVSLGLFVVDEGEKTLQGVYTAQKGEAIYCQVDYQQDEAVKSLLATPSPQALHVLENYTGCLLGCYGGNWLEVAPLIGEAGTVGLVLFGREQPLPEQEPNGDRNRGAILDQIALTLEAHRLQTQLRAALETLRATQARMVEMEKLRTAGTIAASVAHDIRNILSTMQLELAGVPEEVATPLQAHLNRFSAMTHRLLAFSRPKILETEPTLLSALFQRIIPLVSGQAEICGVEIVCQLPEGLPPIDADINQLEHLFVNLCLNGIQAMNLRGGVLTLQGEEVQGAIAVKVADTGEGIVESVIPHLFDPFFTTRKNGLGLGLFSCKRIVEEHNGTISVQSRLGEGTSFLVTFPLSKDRALLALVP